MEFAYLILQKSAKCWKNGEISYPEFVEQMETYTTEECQHQCQKNSGCLYFSYDMPTNSCKLFDSKASNHYVQHSPTVYGPKECYKGKL